jgi:hypothetical protein
MNKNNPLVATFLLLLFLNSCGAVSEGLGGSKKRNSDEFLVEKKAPLVLPPSFGELPEPGKKIDENQLSIRKDTSDIEEIINQSSSIDKVEKNDDLKNSIEESIIKKIKNQKIKTVKKDLDKTIKKKTEIPENEGFFSKLKRKFNNLEH